MPEPKFNIVQVEPEIAQNTGTIGRLCVATGSKLYLAGKRGFEIDSAKIRRAGLDYWLHLDLELTPSFDEILTRFPDGRFHFFAQSGERPYYEAVFRPGDFLVFGKESSGLGAEIIERYYDRTFYIPMFGPTRSLNVSNAVSIALYEAIRQNIGEMGRPVR